MAFCVKKNMLSESDVCSECNKSVSRSKSHECQNCFKRSHVKCLGIDSKYLQNAWLCNTCHRNAFPFFETELTHSNDKKIDSELSHLKSYFESLNLISDNVSNTENEEVTYGNCKYYRCEEFSTLPFKHKSLSCFHINISSLEKHFDELLSLFLRLNHSFDVIGISETRLNSTLSGNISLPGYSFIHTPSASNAGGVGLYISNRCTFKPRTDLSDILYSQSYLESVFVELILRGQKNIIVGCIYKHPLMDVNDFNHSYLSPFLSKTSKENKSLILLGDFNINLLKSNSVSSSSDFLDLLGSYELLPSITLPTRISNYSSTLIDNIFVSSSISNSISGNLSVVLSDHLPQFFLFHKEFPSNLKSSFYRKWSKFDSAKFREDFSSINWDEILSLEKENVDVSFNSFYDKYSSLFDEHVPIAKFTKHQIKLQSKPWITKGILTSMKIRDNLFCEFKTCINVNIKSFLRDRYKFYRNRIVSLLRLSKKLYFSSYFTENLNNTHKIWKGVRELISTKYSSSSNSEITLQVNGSLSSNPSIVAETFNDFFSSIAEKIRAKIPFTRHHFSKWLNQPNGSSIFLSPVTPNEVFKIITSFNKGKSYGPSSIPYPILNSVSESLSVILSKLVNLSFSTGVFPSKLKEARR